MPIGTGTYNPNGRFAAPRSYYRGIAHNQVGYVVLEALGVYHWVYIADPDIIFTFVLDSRFYTWNSNRWTLDHMITDCYATFTLGGPSIPQNFTWSLFTRPDQPSTYLEMKSNGVDFGAWTYTDLPPAPAGYWLPKPFGA